jgi:hypothetical protein
MSSRPLFMYNCVRDGQSTRISESAPIDDDFVVSRLLHVCRKGSGRDLTRGPAWSPLSSGRTCTTSEVCCCYFASLAGGFFDFGFTGIRIPCRHVPLEQPHGGKEE